MITSVISKLVTFTVAAGTEQTYKFLGAPEPWIITLLVLAVIAGAAYFYYRETRDSGKGWKIFLGSLRVILFLILFLLIFEPVLSTEESDIRYSYVIVLIDNSLSMSLTDIYEDVERASALSEMSGVEIDKLRKTPRIELVRKILGREDNEFFRKLTEKNHVKIFTFSKNIASFGELARLDEEELAEAALAEEKDKEDTGEEPEGLDLEKLEATGRLTSIGDTLTQAVNQLKAERISGVIIITDGRSNTGIIEPHEAAKRLALGNIPVHTIGVGNPNPPKDIALSNLDVKEVVMMGDKVNFDFTVNHQGYEGETVRLRLKLNGSDESSFKPKTITLRKENVPQRITIVHKPRKSGDYNVEICIDKLDGEKDETNNALTCQVKVKDEKIKVLFVAGSPTWEYRYLKTALTRDEKTMEVYVLLQSADPKFIQECTPGLSPLREFPHDRKELFKYHVIIFHDVDPDPTRVRFRLTKDDLKNVKDFASSQGGGFIMIAGEDNAPQKYKGTPIEDILPIVIQDLKGKTFNWRRTKKKAFRPVITEDGWNNFMMRLDSDPKANRELWMDIDKNPMNSLPGFYWFHPIAKAKPNAIVLARHPTARDKSRQREKQVIFAYSHVGRGFSFYSGVDSTWRWRAGVGDRYFYKFWGQVIRFVATPRLFGKTKRHSLGTDRERYTIKDTIRITARVLDQDFQYSKEKTQTVYLEKPDKAREPIELTVNPKKDGHYSGTITAEQLGTYKLWIGRDIVDADKLAYKTFSVVVPEKEKENPIMDMKLLKAVSDQGSDLGAGFCFLEDLAVVPEKLDPIIEKITSRRTTNSLIDSMKLLWIVFALFMTIITVEWIIRKRNKML